MDAIYVIDKPKGLTSRDVVNQMGKILGTKHLGHTGTLDPLATGVLVIAVGRATKIIDLLTSTEKEYLAEVKMGLLTDTLDITGNVLEEVEVPSVSFMELEKTLQSFVGKYEQEVPLYSAVRVQGKRLYEYARENQKVALPKREVEISKITLLNLQQDTFSFVVRVSKGTYIRSLIRDIGVKLQIPMSMQNLRRLHQGMFSIDKAIPLAQFTKQTPGYSCSEVLQRIYPRETISQELVKKVQNGAKITLPRAERYLLLYDEQDHLLALYQKEAEHYRAFKIFYQREMEKCD